MLNKDFLPSTNDVRDHGGTIAEICSQCGIVKTPSAFSHRKTAAHKQKQICRECEKFNRHEHYQHALLRQALQEQQERQAQKQQTLLRRIAFQQLYAERQRTKEYWQRQQPDRLCPGCRRYLPATAFNSIFSTDHFVLYTHCKTCHNVLLHQRQLACCLCGCKTVHADFLTLLDGYSLHDDGFSLSLCCKHCAIAFLALPLIQQQDLTHTCCQRTFPSDQFIYAEIEPGTNDIRYIGRTNRPKRRHAQHLASASSRPAFWGPTRKRWYTRNNWMYDLSLANLSPTMHILQKVSPAPLVVEYEQRYIWHGMQQNLNLLNVQAMDESLLARIRSSNLDFLHAPFDVLVQQQFFSPTSFPAFVRRWYS